MSPEGDKEELQKIDFLSEEGERRKPPLWPPPPQPPGYGAGELRREPSRRVRVQGRGKTKSPNQRPQKPTPPRIHYSL